MHVPGVLNGKIGVIINLLTKTYYIILRLMTAIYYLAMRQIYIYIYMSFHSFIHVPIIYPSISCCQVTRLQFYINIYFTPWLCEPPGSMGEVE